MSDLVSRLRDYGLTLDPNLVFCDRRVVDEAADHIEALNARIKVLEEWYATANQQRNEAEAHAQKLREAALVTIVKFDGCGKAAVMNTPLGINNLREAAALTPTSALADVRDEVDELFYDAREEAQKAMRKFTQPNYVISKVAEEAGEVVKAAIHCAEGRETPENVAGEIKQAIAMLIRLYVEGDQVHGLPPVAAAIRARKEAGE